MKKAVIALYIIAAVQAVSTVVACVFFYSLLIQSFEEAGRRVIQMCDQRYVIRQ